MSAPSCIIFSVTAASVLTVIQLAFRGIDVFLADGLPAAGGPYSPPPDSGFLRVPGLAKVAESRIIPKGHVVRTRCPRVFVYNLPEPFQDLEQPYSDFYAGYKLEELNTTVAFGQGLSIEKPFLTVSWERALALILLYRFRQSKHCVTSYPAEADLFYIPLLSGGKGAAEVSQACQRLADDPMALLRELPHLNSRTARRHFFAVQFGFFQFSECRGFFSNPQGIFQDVAKVSMEVQLTPNLLQRFPGLAEQHRLNNTKLEGDWPGKQLHLVSRDISYTRLYTMPHASSVHWSKEYFWLKPPWVERRSSFLGGEPRDIFASYVGSFNHGDLPVRSRLESLCTLYSTNSSTLSCSPFFGYEAMELKHRSVFCIEPIGDTIARKSVLDSIVSGCIPVFFGYAQSFLYPDHWEGWHDDAFLLVDRLRFINGSLDLIRMLRTVPKPQVKRMQRLMAQFGERFQYSEDEEATEEDALSVVLRRLWYDAMVP